MQSKGWRAGMVVGKPTDLLNPKQEGLALATLSREKSVWHSQISAAMEGRGVKGGEGVGGPHVEQ